MDYLFDGPVAAPITVVLAHGAGGAMDSPAMSALAAGLAERGVRVARFEFPYMAGRRSGRRRGPDRQSVLVDTYRAAVAGLGAPAPLVVGGKSMGGRMASLVADELAVAGLLCFGFPFHAPGRPPGDRIAHLAALRTPTLILQGARDPFGTAADVATYELSPAIRVHWVGDGDHDLRPRASSGRTHRGNLDEALDTAAAFLAGLQP